MLHTSVSSFFVAPSSLSMPLSLLLSASGDSPEVNRAPEIPPRAAKGRPSLIRKGGEKETRDRIQSKHRGPLSLDLSGRRRTVVLYPCKCFTREVILVANLSGVVSKLAELLSYR